MSIWIRLFQLYNFPGDNTRCSFHLSTVLGLGHETMHEFYLNAQEISAAICAFKHFPKRTPNRWNLVSKLVIELLKDDKNHVRFPIGRQCRSFNFSPEHCRHLERLLSKDFNLIFTQEERRGEIVHGEKAQHKDAFKPLVLLPPVDNCVRCSRKLQVHSINPDVRGNATSVPVNSSEEPLKVLGISWNTNKDTFKFNQAITLLKSQDD